MLGVLIAVLLLLAGGLAYETSADAAARRAHPPPGVLVDAGGYRLHLHVMGERQGLPTVILEHGGTSMSAQWGWIMPALARHTQVVAYDRPGLGWSDPAPANLDASGLVRDLQSALQAQGIRGPYVVVGHSMGALMARVFAQTFPDDVAGLVLLDPRGIEQHEALSFSVDPLMLAVIRSLGRLGVLRLSGLAAREADGLPPHSLEQATALFASHRQINAWATEDVLGESATTMLLAGEDLDDLPLLVLGATQVDGAFNPRQREVLAEQHLRLSQRSSHGAYQIVPGAGHITIITHEAPALAVSQAILDFLQTGLDAGAILVE